MFLIKQNTVKINSKLLNLMSSFLSLKSFYKRCNRSSDGSAPRRPIVCIDPRNIWNLCEIHLRLFSLTYLSNEIQVLSISFEINKASNSVHVLSKRQPNKPQFNHQYEFHDERNSKCGNAEDVEKVVTCSLFPSDENYTSRQASPVIGDDQTKLRYNFTTQDVITACFIQDCLIFPLFLCNQDKRFFPVSSTSIPSTTTDPAATYGKDKPTTVTHIPNVVTHY